MSSINPERQWIRDLEHVSKFGSTCSPRGMLVYESLGFQSYIQMANPIIFNDRRALGYKFMAAEAAWILSGRNDVESISPFSKNISRFSDDGIIFAGAYGPPLKSQLSYVLLALEQDADTRQAVSTIWNRNPDPSKDIPCTISLQWMIRNHALHCIATMRSSDLWLGHPYDIFNFSAYSFALLLELNKIRQKRGEFPIILGGLYLTAGSKHIYDNNLRAVEEVISHFENHGLTAWNQNPVFVPQRYKGASDFIEHLWECANSSRGALTLYGEDTR